MEKSWNNGPAELVISEEFSALFLGGIPASESDSTEPDSAPLDPR